MISVITSLFMSEKYVVDFYRRTTKVLKRLKISDYEIIFVNDGSPDRSLANAILLKEKDNRIKILDLSRNFGHHEALLAGIEVSSGNEVFLIDSDLEEQPEWLADFYKMQIASNSDVVYGVQKKRKGSLFERASGHLYFRLTRQLTDLALPKNFVTARLMSRRYANALLEFKEIDVNIGAMFTEVGFTQIPFEVNKLSTSPTSYSLRKKLSHFINTITSYSSKPLTVIPILGVTFLVGSLFYIGFMVVRLSLGQMAPDGFTTIILFISTSASLIMIQLGMIGLYISKIFTQTKHRPRVIIKKFYD